MGLMDLRVEEQDLSAGDLELEAKMGESLRVIARGVGGGNADTIVEEYIREETMTAFPADDGETEVLLEETVRTQQTDFFAALRDYGFRAPELMIPEGQTYQLTSWTGSGTATVLYEEMGAGRADGNQPGGPGTKTRTFVSTGQIVEEVPSGGTETTDVDSSVNPSQLNDWPYEENVEANYEYDLQALSLGLDSGSGGNTSLDAFRLTSAESDFLARESALVDPGLAQFPDATLDIWPLMFQTTPTFSPGADLDLTVEISNSGSGAEDAIVNAMMVFYRRAV